MAVDKCIQCIVSNNPMCDLFFRSPCSSCRNLGLGSQCALPGATDLSHFFGGHSAQQEAPRRFATPRRSAGPVRGSGPQSHYATGPAPQSQYQYTFNAGHQDQRLNAKDYADSGQHQNKSLKRRRQPESGTVPNPPTGISANRRKKLRLAAHERHDDASVPEVSMTDVERQWYDQYVANNGLFPRSEAPMREYGQPPPPDPAIMSGGLGGQPSDSRPPNNDDAQRLREKLQQVLEENKGLKQQQENNKTQINNLNKAHRRKNKQMKMDSQSRGRPLLRDEESTSRSRTRQPSTASPWSPPWSLTPPPRTEFDRMNDEMDALASARVDAAPGETVADTIARASEPMNYDDWLTINQQGVDQLGTQILPPPVASSQQQFDSFNGDASHGAASGSQRPSQQTFDSFNSDASHGAASQRPSQQRDQHGDTSMTDDNRGHGVNPGAPQPVNSANEQSFSEFESDGNRSTNPPAQQQQSFAQHPDIDRSLGEILSQGPNQSQNRSQGGQRQQRGNGRQPRGGRGSGGGRGGRDRSGPKHLAPKGARGYGQ
ncbi:hypothetical protein M409DRAFT_19311 [Zasmidium cellare ATCC 36951]|uniref:Uncharacterized protein n=1 Tax=Zasmidium cellare ATCC 36951 TaxID=1080233 RepID=A0A6A6CWB7_ZASCE|nr:uncharacterized protein M409DRAFT_19311 [Zasmidium cellare ATCC 36951]KAF2170490.1 hypothetical protein M409DRAFT_19311 [Zasmidium cellare ATCC 36951]